MNTRQNLNVISKINRDTKENLIRWNSVINTPSSLSSDNKLVGKAYVCKILNKTLRLYKYQVKNYFDEGVFEIIDKYCLEFIDTKGDSEWEFFDDISIKDLYESVRFKTTGVQDFIDNYLNS